MMIDERYLVTSVWRALSIMEFISENGGATVTEISRGLDIPKSTVFKIVVTLISKDYLAEIDNTRRYCLGIKLFELGYKAVGHIEERQEIHRMLQRLSDTVRETAHFAILVGTDVLYLDKVEGSSSLRMVTSIGGRRPAYCTGTGKALLAWLPKENLRMILGGVLSEVHLDKLARELVEVRANGYALDLEENEKGIICIGAPVRNHKQQVVAAISVSGPSVRIGKKEIPVFAEHVKDAADQIHEKMGYFFSSFPFVDLVKKSVKI